MCADRSLWVDDAYALRCRGCNTPFTWICRKHHCRQCGQVFCSDCLYATPTSLEQLRSRLGLRPAHGETASHAEKFVTQSSRPTKVCHRCARNMAASFSHGSDACVPLAASRTTATAHVTAGHSAEGSASLGGHTPKMFTSPLTRIPSAHISPLVSPSSPDPPPSAESGPSAPLSAGARAASNPPTHSDNENLSPTRTIEMAGGVPAPPAAAVESTTTAAERSETDEDRAVHMSLAAPVKRRRNRLQEWLAAVQTKAAAEKTEEREKARSADEATRTLRLPPELPDDASDIALFDHVGDTDVLAGACTTLGPVTAPTPPSSACVWNEVCLRVLTHRTVRAVTATALSTPTHASSDELARLLMSLAVRALRCVAVPLAGLADDHVEFLLTEDGRTEASEVLPGFAFFASLASNAARLPAALTEPRFLLLTGDVTFTASNESSSCVGVLEYMSSYRGHLDSYLKKIARWRPDVIVVERGMHHYLQDALTQQYPSVRLLLHVGQRQLERLARCTGGRVVSDLSFVSLAQLSSAQATPLGTCERCELRAVGGRVLCVASGLKAPLYISVLVRGVNTSPTTAYVQWRQAWSAVLVTAYHLCAQAHLFQDMGLSLDRARLISDPAQHRWSLNLAVAYPPSVLDALSRTDVCQSAQEERGSGSQCDAAGQSLSDVLVVEQIEVGALEDTTVSLLADNGAQHTAGFPERRALRFYQPGPHGDETLFQFLLGRLTSKHRTLLFVHEERVVRVATTTEERVTALSQYACSSTTEAFDLFQSAQSQWAALDVDHARGSDAASPSERRTPETMSAPYCYLRCCHCADPGTRSDRGEDKDTGNTDGTARAQPLQGVAVCTPHTLNLSLGSFLELLFHPDQDAVVCGHCGQPVFARADPARTAQTGEPAFCFVLFPAGTAVVTVSFHCSPLAVRRLRLPPTRLLSSVPDTAAATVADDPLARLYDKHEMAELVRDVTLLAERCRHLTEHLDALGGVTSESMKLAREVAELQARLEQTTVTDVTACRWAALQSLLRTYSALSARLPPAAAPTTTLAGTVSASLPNTAPSLPLAPAVPTNPSGSTTTASPLPSELIQPWQWLYSPFAARAVRWAEPTSLIALALVQARRIETLSASARGQGGDVALFATRAEAVAALTHHAQKGPAQAPQRLHLDDLRTACGQPLRAASDATHVATVEVHLDRAFAALRAVATGGHAERIIASLWRCRRYQPAGGKSHSDFFRTLDDCFLLKRIRPIELRHFVGSSAVRYFARMRAIYEEEGGSDGGWAAGSAASGATACALGKILGVFTLSRRSLHPAAESSGQPEQEHYMLVENLAAHQRVLSAYDLKGSQRNRVAAAGASVGLDENLVSQLRKGQYLFIPESEKVQLMRALSDDASLLVSSSVMDYSLLVAATTADKTSSSPSSPTMWSVGLIDYMQPYTGAKALESKMKSGIDTVLGYTNHAPTIIDPARYERRFLLWMNRYFCGVPNRLSLPLCADAVPEPATHRGVSHPPSKEELDGQ